MAARSKARLHILEEAEVPLSDLVEDPENANVHDEENLAAIGASLQRFGQPERLIVRKKDRIVFAGNGRVEAMRRLGWKKARVQFIDGSNSVCRAYAIVANQTPRSSRFDLDILVPQLEELNAQGQLDGTGFTLQDLEDLRDDLKPKERKEKPGKGGAAKLVVTCPNCGHDVKVGDRE
jgi:ParB-like chromosome segregation protein Spo0J